MKTPNLPSLAASFFLFVGPALAQAPEPPSAAPGAGAASTPLAEILPRGPAVSPVEALARSGAWADLKVAAQQLLAEQAPTMKTDPAPVVAAFALLALANAGSGDPGGGICRWQAAQILDPRLRQADLSAYGEPGRLLQANPVQDNVSAHETEKGTGSGAKAGKVQAPKVLHRRAPEMPPAARRARVQGAVSVKAILAESGRVTQPRIVQAPPLGLGATTLDALCDWSFEPAVFEGKPVKVHYDLTMNFKLDQPVTEQ
jgi:TonB family protein